MVRLWLIYGIDIMNHIGFVIFNLLSGVWYRYHKFYDLIRTLLMMRLWFFHGIDIMSCWEFRHLQLMIWFMISIPWIWWYRYHELYLVFGVMDINMFVFLSNVLWLFFACCLAQKAWCIIKSVESAKNNH